MTTSRRTVLAAALAVCILPLALSARAVDGFDLQGHRGTRGNAPENTLAAFSRALDIGVTTLELDIGITADGVAVISHDPYLNRDIARDPSGSWPARNGPLIHSLSLAQLQQWQLGRIDPASAYARQFPDQVPQDGERVPTLAALFEMVKARGADAVRFNIETKLDPERPDDTASPQVFVDTLLAVVRQHGMEDRVTVQSFDWRSLRRVRQLAPRIPTVYLTVQTARTDNTRDSRWTDGLQRERYDSVPAMVQAAGGQVWSPNAGAVTEALVQEAHRLGLAVVPWTVNAEADMDRLIGWKVDGLISDYPDRLRKVLAARGMALPAPVPRR